MTVNLSGRHFLSMLDFSAEELLEVLETARRLKRNVGSDHPMGFLKAGMSTKEHADQAETLPLRHKTLSMIFLKPSLRTRVSFETGMTQLGGHAIYLGPSDISLGKRETTEDIAIVLSRYVDAIMARVFGHDVVAELAEFATVPVINGLSDHEHPCQILADFQTILERKGRLEGIRLCYIGDGNNVAHSLMLGAAQLGMHATVICPAGFEPADTVLEQGVELGRKTGSKVVVSNDMTAVEGADVVYTDVWASMGQEAEAEARKKAFAGYCLNNEVMRRADKDAIILHCLPAHYGEEIEYETSRLPNSAMFDQAENRLHAQKALLFHVLGVADQYSDR